MVAATMAKIAASSHSRPTDFFFFFFTSVVVVVVEVERYLFQNANRM